MAYSICNSWTRLRSPKCLVGKQLQLLYSWEFFLNSACSRCLLRGHMTFNNQTVSCQNLWAGKIAKNLWRQKVIVHCHWLLARFSFINFLAVLPPWTYTKLKLEKISGQKLPTLFVGWEEGLDLCESENAPEMQKCPKAFVYDCRLRINLDLLFSPKTGVYVKHGTYPEPTGTCRNLPEPAGINRNLPEPAGITRNRPGIPRKPK